jgi:hypothetical protein
MTMYRGNSVIEVIEPLPDFDRLSSDRSVVEVIDLPPGFDRFSDGSVISDHPSDVGQRPAEPWGPLPQLDFDGALRRVRARQAEREEQPQRAEQEAAEEERRDDAQDEEFAELPEANLPITDEHFMFRMEDKTYVMEAR